MEYKDSISLIFATSTAAPEDALCPTVVGHDCYKLCTDTIKSVTIERYNKLEITDEMKTPTKTGSLRKLIYLHKTVQFPYITQKLYT